MAAEALSDVGSEIRMHRKLLPGRVMYLYKRSSEADLIIGTGCTWAALGRSEREDGPEDVDGAGGAPGAARDACISKVIK